MAITIDGTGTITGISAGGLPDASIVKADLAANAVSFVSYAIIADQKASGTPGGTITSGAWRTRDLNTEVADPDGIVSISGNQFTLGAGSYLIRWNAPGNDLNAHQTRLYNATDAQEIALGDCLYCEQSASTVTNVSSGAGRVTITSSKTFEIQHRSSYSQGSTAALGFACGFGIEQYTTVEIFKES
jgi:hypothetical protein